MVPNRCGGCGSSGGVTVSSALACARVSARVGDAEAFRVWVHPHLPLMRGLARRLVGDDAEDVVQEALVRAWRRWHLFDEGRGSAPAWLLTLTARAASRQWRTRSRHPLSLLTRSVEVGSTDVYANLDLRRAIDGLSARQKLAVNLFYYLDLPISEVASVMGCSEGTVKSTLSDARARLRPHLEDS